MVAQTDADEDHPSAEHRGSTPHLARRATAGLPLRRLVVLQEAAVEVLARLAADDRVVHARRAVDEVQRRLEALLGEPHLRRVRALVGDPAGVDGGHEDAVGQELLGARAREHVERGLRHVRVRMPGTLVAAAELALHRGDVDDVRAPRRRRGERRPQPADEDERRGHVAELHLEQLDRDRPRRRAGSSCCARAGRAPGRRRRSRGRRRPAPATPTRR